MEKLNVVPKNMDPSTNATSMKRIMPNLVALRPYSFAYWIVRQLMRRKRVQLEDLKRTAPNPDQKAITEDMDHALTSLEKRGIVEIVDGQVSLTSNARKHLNGSASTEQVISLLLQDK